MAHNPSPARKPECLAAIRAQINEHGAPDRVAICKMFPEINRATIWNWVRLAVANQPSRRELEAAGKAIEQRIASGIVDHLPAMPSPNAIARGGDKALRKLDFSAEIPKLYSDAEMLRAFAITVRDGDDGEPVEKIKNPVAFEKSIKARASLIETSLKVLQEVWDMRAMQNFYEMIVDEIGRESPECQQRILLRLAALNSRHGMTMAMRL